ncbi:NERD domain-containing protein [Azonexus hydrophilus]|uniref:NERD domain-containing protein n=1 Tax=Azonexus hydrophilus TaxID=418702 RepID=A0ABZ2XPP9_9RHOO
MSLASALKGWLGETVLTVAKKIVLDGNIYRDLNNVTIPTTNGTTQIDHIIVSRYGVFVIETKNMEGWIFGDEKQPQWTQSLYGKKFRFQNPLHQNYRHTKALEEFLGLPPSHFHSVVCFVGESCKLKTEMPANVINGSPFGYIKAKTEVLMLDEQVATIVESIKSGMRPKNFLGLATRETKREHLASLNERHASTTICPKCGSALVLRTIKKGEKAGQAFHGCSKYPACRFMRGLHDTAQE